MLLRNTTPFKEVCLAAFLFVFILMGCQPKAKPTLQAKAGYSSAQAQLEAMYVSSLQKCINELLLLEEELGNWPQARQQYRAARRQFKLVEPLLWAADKQNYLSLNAPNILKVDEEDATDVKVKEPFGFQRLEEELFADEPEAESIAAGLTKTIARLKLLQANARLKLEDRHVLSLLRDALVRIATTGLSGYDSPVLENSLAESAVVYERLSQILEIYESNFTQPGLYQAWQQSIQASQRMLSAGNFAQFNRYAFIQKHTHTQLALWTETVDDWGVTFPYQLALNTRATSLFSEETFNTQFFADYHDAPPVAMRDLGKMLFNETALSANGQMSCATCHQANQAFTDGLKVFPGQTRNTPSLLYAGLQQGFFYDKRSGSLEGQVVSVVNNELEFHTNLDSMAAVVGRMPRYAQAFDSLYPGPVKQEAIRLALATYIRSLSPFNSKFDRNINGQETSLTEGEIKGFNLFMGKAKCATCHFPPTFNGTIPPNFAESELEMLGVPNHAQNPTAVDADAGRYNLFSTEERRFFFKTPTVRNSNRTAPYMHNGIYATLEEVLDFYNVGGGEGLGLESPNQTLPPDSLHLNPQEIQDIISFLRTLDDKENSASAIAGY